PDRTMHHLDALVPHALIALRLFTGTWTDPAYIQHTGLGYYWPPLAWAAGMLLVWWLLRPGARHPRAVVACVVLALLGWIAAHAVLYSMYYFPDTRFYTAPLAWAWILTGVGFAAALGLAPPRLQQTLGRV